jgi:hypothetical protein
MLLQRFQNPGFLGRAVNVNTPGTLDLTDLYGPVRPLVEEPQNLSVDSLQIFAKFFKR